MKLFVLLACVLCLSKATAWTQPSLRGNEDLFRLDREKECESNDSFTYWLVESVPQGLDFWTNMTIFAAWHDMFSTATTSIDIAAFYISLTGGAAADGGWTGTTIYNDIVAAAKRGVKVRIAINTPNAQFPQLDALNLQKSGAADVRFMNFTEILGPDGGILHTKMIVTDNSSFFIGSANMDWRSLSQVKELGVYGKGSTLTAQQLDKVFLTYWYLGNHNELPPNGEYPEWLHTPFNVEHPIMASLNGSEPEPLFLSVSPPPMRPAGWVDDLDAIIRHFQLADEFVYIEMMDFLPALVYETPKSYWGDLTDAIRAAAYDNGTEFRILIGYWEHSMPDQIYYMRALDALENVTVEYYKIAPLSPPVPFTRVAHDKWMVTDRGLYVGTSNWVGDYFTTTAGVGISIYDWHARDQAVAIFHRDWGSEYAGPIPDAF